MHDHHSPQHQKHQQQQHSTQTDQQDTPLASPALDSHAVVQLQRLIGNRAVSRMVRPQASASQGTVQRVIKGLRAGKAVRSNARVLRGLTHAQISQIQALHRRSKEYTVRKARLKVGASPLPPKLTTFRKGRPFPFRYNSDGKNTMDTVSSGPPGFVQIPVGGMPEAESSGFQVSFSINTDFGSLPRDEERKVDQTTIMDSVSPNDAARQLNLQFDGDKSWEWLHLVAFTIGETHVNGLSKDSIKLIERTNQPQQIRENLVLGSAAANTEMLSFEAKIKDVLVKNPTWKLNLIVFAGKDDRPVLNKKGRSVTIPVANVIHYHFNFETAPNSYTPPIVIAFNPQAITNPASKSYDEVVREIDAVVSQSVQLKEPLRGPSTSGLDPVGRGGSV